MLGHSVVRRLNHHFFDLIGHVGKELLQRGSNSYPEIRPLAGVEGAEAFTPLDRFRIRISCDDNYIDGNAARLE